MTFQYCLFFFLFHCSHRALTPRILFFSTRKMKNDDEMLWGGRARKIHFLKSHNIATLILRYSRHASCFVLPAREKLLDFESMWQLSVKRLIGCECLQHKWQTYLLLVLLRMDFYEFDSFYFPPQALNIVNVYKKFVALVVPWRADKWSIYSYSPASHPCRWKANRI